jgi:predicted MFS family arabinose efflux permease
VRSDPEESTAGATGAALAPGAARAIVFLSVASFASSANIRLADPLIPAVATEFGVTAGQAAQIVTAFAIAYGVTQFVHGPLGDRYGKARLVALASAVAAVLVVASAFATSLAMLAGARLAVGMVAAAIIPLSLAFVGDVAPYASRQATLARLLTGITLGMIFGQTAGGLIAEAFGWRMAFVAVAVCLAAAAIGLWSEIARGGPAAERGRAGTSLAAAYRDAALLTRDPWVRTILAVVFCEGFILLGAFTFASAHLHEDFAMSYGEIGLMTGLYGAGGLVYSLMAARLVGWLGERGLARSGGLVAGAGFALLALMPVWWLGGLAVFCVGLGFMMLHNTLQTNATQMAPQARGAGVALFASCFFLGTTFGVPLFARLYDGQGGPAVFLIAACLLPALAFVFAALLVRRPAH